MKLLHFSDTHLGFSDYNKVDPQSGLNQREQDVYDAWNKVIDAVFEHQPDVVVHAGDMFHTPRPSNRAIRVALEGIQRLSQAGIPLVMVSGNHETPRIRSTGSIFESPALFPHVYAAYSGKLERFSVKGVDFYCLPHCSLTEELEQAVEDLKSAVQTPAAKKVLVTHGAWTGKSFYGLGEFNEQRLPDLEEVAGVTFDYIALGHYHRFVEVKANACYSSSTERTSFNEHNSTCGYLLVDLESAERSYREIRTRPMVKVPALDCSGKTTTMIYKALSAAAATIVDGAMVHITLDNLEDEAFLKLDFRLIDDMFKQALFLEKQVLRKTAGHNSGTSSYIKALPIEFESFLENLPSLELDKERLRSLGAYYLGQE